MSDLFDEVPDALAFCMEVVKQVDRYRLYPSESFNNLTMGVFSSTTVDSQNQAFSKGALEHFVSAVNAGPFWMLAQHDPRIQPVGRIIAAELFYSPASHTYFVAGVAGTYDAKSTPSFADVGLRESLTGAEGPDMLPETPEDVLLRIGANPHEIDEDILFDALSDAPPIVSRSVEPQFRKAADPLTIVTIFLLSRTPFLQKYQEKLGEKAAEQTSAALAWIRDKFSRTLAARFRREILYELTFSQHNCRVQLLIDSKDPVIVGDAVDSLQDAVTRASRLLENGAHLELDKLVYLYDHRESKRWLPLHAASRKYGVISDRPQLVSMDSFRGFSLGGASVTQLSAPRSDTAQDAAPQVSQTHQNVESDGDTS